MAETDHDVAAAMLANALIANQGSRRLATIEAALRIDQQPNAEGRALWTRVRDFLRSPYPIPHHRGHFPSIPNPHALHYERVRLQFADGDAVTRRSAKRNKGETHG